MLGPVRALRVVQFEAVTPLWLRRRSADCDRCSSSVAVSGLLCGRGLPARALQLLGEPHPLWLGLKDSGPDGTYPELR